MKKNNEQEQIQRLLQILETLRGPDGCNWDKKQTLSTMAEHIKEESDEACEALKGDNALHMREELGDLLMTIGLAAQIAKEQGLFGFEEVSEAICEKLIFRHPHIFKDKAKNASIGEVEELWKQQKAKEKAKKAKLSFQINEYLSLSNPLIASEKIQSIAAEVGFDFPSVESAFDKIPEEVREIKEALKLSMDHNNNLEEELGDLVFAAINVARMSNIDMTKALQKANSKFAKRFEIVEELAENAGGITNKNIEELDEYWNKAKKKLKNGLN
jgi:MazG family protein